MILKEVEIFDFKSILHERIELRNNQLCLVGINESGKTNILEAISFLNFGKQLERKQLNKSAVGYPRGYPIISGLFE